MQISNKAADRELQVSVTINPHLEPCSYELNPQFEKTDPVNMKMCSVTVDLLPQAVLEDVQVVVSVRKPLKSSKKSEFYGTLSERTRLSFHVYLDELLEIPSLELGVEVVYVSNMRIPRVISRRIRLPLKLAMETCGAQKEAQHKITLNVNQNQVPLSTIFPGKLPSKCQTTFRPDWLAVVFHPCGVCRCLLLQKIHLQGLLDVTMSSSSWSRSTDHEDACCNKTQNIQLISIETQHTKSLLLEKCM